MIVIVQISEQQYALSGTQDTKQNTYHIVHPKMEKHRTSFSI